MRSTFIVFVVCAGCAERAWFASEVVWALTGTYTDKTCAICLTKLQKKQFFRQQAPPGKVKFTSSTARDLKSSHCLLR